MKFSEAQKLVGRRCKLHVEYGTGHPSPARYSTHVTGIFGMVDDSTRIAKIQSDVGEISLVLEDINRVEYNGNVVDVFISTRHVHLALNLIKKRKVAIEIVGGVAHVIQSPDDIEVEIVDCDDDQHAEDI